MVREDQGRTGFYVCFCVRVQQKSEDPKIEPMADDAITQGDIVGQGSLAYISGYAWKQWYHNMQTCWLNILLDSGIEPLIDRLPAKSNFHDVSEFTYCEKSLNPSMR